MVAMRRKRGGGGRGRRVGQGETLYSLRSLVMLTLGFLSIIMGLLIVPLVTKYISNSLSTTDSSSKSSTKALIDKDALSSLIGRVFHSPSELPDTLIRQLDAILVLGGGRPKSLTEPPIYVQRRCDDAAAIVQKYQKEQHQHQQHSSSSSSTATKTLPLLCLSAGTAHLPQLLSADGLPIWESTSCAAYLQKHYNDDSDSKNKLFSNLEVHVETTSFDTIGNAFYARTSHTDLHQRPNTWRNLLIVTNEFHIERAQAIFDWIFSLPTTTRDGGDIKEPKRKTNRRKHDDNGDDDDDRYKLFYLASPNVGLSDEAVTARVQKERASLKSVHALSQRYNNSLSDVYEFLTRHHDLYTASKLVQKEPSSSVVSDLVRKSYGAAER